MDINTCAVLAEAVGLRAIALYSHLLPAAIAVYLGWYAAVKTKYSPASVAFLFFTLAVATWLINDVVLWALPSYSRVAFFWSWIDLTDVAFFILAAFFFGTLARGSISSIEKLILIALCIPSFLFTVTGNSVTGFDHTWCEMYNNDNAVLYKSFAEWASLALAFFSLIVVWKKSDRKRKVALSIVFFALLLFLATFSITESLAAQTAIYEISLYGLFVLPVFLIIMVFAITNLEVFKIRYLSAQVLIYVLILLVASQLLFLENSTDALLNGLTLALAVVISVILLQNETGEMNSLLQIEALAGQLSTANKRLKELDGVKSQFLSFASHQLRAPLGAIRWQAQLLLDGTIGGVTPEVRETVAQIEGTAGDLAALVNDFLDLRKLEEGKMEFQFEQTDVAALTKAVVSGLTALAQKRKLQLTFTNRAKQAVATVDIQKFRQVVQNLVDNSIKYTDTGSVAVLVDNNASGDIVISVTDTGHGMSAELMPKLFDQFVRAPSDAKLIEGTGLGLYIAKQIVLAHKGKIWATSPGSGKGSTFWVSLPPWSPSS